MKNLKIFRLQCIDSNYNIKMQKRLANSPEFHYTSCFGKVDTIDRLDYYYNTDIAADTGGIIECGRTSINNPDTSCFGVDATIATMGDFPLQRSGWAMTSGDDNNFLPLPFTLKVKDFTIRQMEVCNSKSVCDTLKINHTAIDTICSLSQPINITVSKSKECLSKINWSIDSAAATLTPKDDTTVGINFLKEWDGFLYANINGCTQLTDSVRFKVLKLSMKNNILGNDTILCLGDTIKVNYNLKSNFISYLWNNGSISSAISVTKKGVYSVKATLFNGCYVLDSVNIVNILRLPEVSLNKKAILCIGQNNILRAGGGFKKYLWQDGTTDSTYILNKVGEYSVTVFNGEGCKKSDTVFITNLVDTPNAFIQTDTVFCKTQSVTLMPFMENFKSYLWSNGSTASNSTINKPGKYWLIVTDTNGCFGKENINVRVIQCSSNLFVPSAFSPNNDGKNDLLKPTFFGLLQFYRFTVFNRFGQIVFQSTDINRGWDGTINGALQDCGTFIWSCKYQLFGNNEPFRTEQGSTVLIR